jgi:hypothetical protein
MPQTEEILVGLYSMAGLAGLGLLVTAIILTAKTQLSLFDALFVFHILFFLGIGATPTGECSARNFTRPVRLPFTCPDARR